MLYYLGRLDDQMNLGGIKVGSEALEARVATLLPDARGHFALTSVPDPMRGETVLLAVEPPASDMRELVGAATLQALKEKGVSAGGTLRTCAIESLPRTATGKIQRGRLRAQANGAASTAPGGAPAQDNRDLTENEARIAALWTRVLGDVAISPEASFFDNGGDSLSGLQVGLVMEGAHLPRAAVQATFEGAPLRAVAATLDPAMKDPVPETDVPVPVLPDRTRLTWSLTLTRALVVMAVLVSHWGPGVLGLLGLPKTMFLPFTRLGTPGFALMFGVGVGLYMLPEMSRAPRAVFHRADRATLLVAAGAGLMAVVSLVHFYMRGDLMNWLTISNAMYSVLIYYLVMLITARLWLPALARIPGTVSLLLLALVLWSGWQLMDVVLPQTQYVSPLELVRLMVGAGGYNIFKLGCMTMAGIAVGIWIARQEDLERIRHRLLILGGLGVLFCGAALLQVIGTIRLTNAASLIGLGFYGSLCLLTMGVSLTILPAWARAGTALRGLLKVALTFGGLALPIYVFHQLVIPTHKTLEIAGVPELASIALPMGIFLAVMLYMGRRIYRMYGS
jgi:hypothetical protein